MHILPRTAVERGYRRNRNSQGRSGFHRYNKYDEYVCKLAIRPSCPSRDVTEIDIILYFHVLVDYVLSVITALKDINCNDIPDATIRPPGRLPFPWRWANQLVSGVYQHGLSITPSRNQVGGA